MKLILVCGARPNFMKIAPLLRAIDRHNREGGGRWPIDPVLVHTGQHYDYEMSEVFFQDLDLPEPDIYLGVGSGTHAEQTGRVMIEFEKTLLKEEPDLVMVVGDVNSTMAAALAAVKLRIPVAHVEAGLRHYDRSIPEEVNRLVADALSDYLFTYSRDTSANLANEGIPEQRIFFVGNVMIDNLRYNEEGAWRRDAYLRTGFRKGEYGVVTIHRPGNVDEEKSLRQIIAALVEISQRIPIVFPCHPRTRQTITELGLLPYFGLRDEHPNQVDRAKDSLLLIAPLGYLDFLNLVMHSRFIITDSGGVQEETTVLNLPCLVLMDRTARPITVEEGTTVLVGSDCSRLQDEVSNILIGNGKTGRIPELWDGKASERIIDIVVRP